MSKNSFWQKPDFVKINEFSLLKLKKCKNRKIDTFTFLAISLAIFELQRRTIPHFNPLNNSFWPYGETFFCRVNSFWAILLNVSTIFFSHTLNNSFGKHLCLCPEATVTRFHLDTRRFQTRRWVTVASGQRIKTIFSYRTGPVNSRNHKLCILLTVAENSLTCA